MTGACSVNSIGEATMYVYLAVVHRCRKLNAARDSQRRISSCFQICFDSNCPGLIDLYRS